MFRHRVATGVSELSTRRCERDPLRLVVARDRAATMRDFKIEIDGIHRRGERNRESTDRTPPYSNGS